VLESVIGFEVQCKIVLVKLHIGISILTSLKTSHCFAPGPTATAVMQQTPAGTVNVYEPGVLYKHRLLKRDVIGEIFSVTGIANACDTKRDILFPYC
jgi:hypothetical protein